MKRLFLTAISACAIMAASAQSGTNSPYSQYGMGLLSEQGNSPSRGMNGVGIAFRTHDKVNYLNPASYSGVDSISFIFDVGMSMQITNFAENGVKKNANNADLEFAMGSFRIIKNLGLGFGFVPYTNVGFNYTDTKPYVQGGGTEEEATYTRVDSHNGTGGVHEAFIGLGWQPVKGLSVGFNFGYLWGSSTKTVSNTFGDGYSNSIVKTYSQSVSSYNLELGGQYEHALNKKDFITVGATYRLGHTLGSKPGLTIASNGTTEYECVTGLELPSRIGVGVAYSHLGKWNVGLDYTLDQWSKVAYPHEYKNESVNSLTHATETNIVMADVNVNYADRHKVNIGGEYCQNEQGRSFLSRLRYRFGVGYATPYYKLGNGNGPKEVSVSAGFGIPVVNGWLSASKHYPMVNISAQWARTSMPNMLTENTFRINLGLTFNERWFAKWKFD